MKLEEGKNRRVAQCKLDRSCINSHLRHVARSLCLQVKENGANWAHCLEYTSIKFDNPIVRRKSESETRKEM